MGVLWPEDYEKVFGKPTKWSLFSEDEEAYEAFRQTIIDSPHYVYDKNKLPFTGVKVYGYNLYLLKLTVDQKKAEGKRLFYIKDETPGLAKVLAFGYYSNNTFYLMANSLIRKTEFQEKMKKISSLYWPIHELQADSAIRKCDIEIKNRQRQSKQLEIILPESYHIIRDVECSASLAAAYVLGQEADYTRWKGLDGKSLAEVYTFYKGRTELAEIQGFWSKLSFSKEESTPIIEEDNGSHLLAEKIILPLQQLLSDRVITPLVLMNEAIVVPEREKLNEIYCHLKGYGYSADGCYSVKDKTMEVFSGAVFSINVSSSFRFSAADYQRRTFIKFHCSTRNSRYTLKEDCVFNSADTAAIYITGQFVDGLSVWMTEKGGSLEEIIDEKVY